MACQRADCPRNLQWCRQPLRQEGSGLAFARSGRKTVRAPARKNTTSAHLSKSSLTCGPSSDRHWPEGNSALRIRITALITAGKSARAGEHPNPKGFGKGSTKSAGPEDGHPTPQGSDPPRVTGQRSTPRRDPASNWNQRPLSLAGLARVSRVKTIKNIDCGGGRSQSRACQSAVSVHGLCHLNGHKQQQPWCRARIDGVGLHAKTNEQIRVPVAGNRLVGTHR